jgi:hypothetical protein
MKVTMPYEIVIPGRNKKPPVPNLIRGTRKSRLLFRHPESQRYQKIIVHHDVWVNESGLEFIDDRTMRVMELVKAKHSGLLEMPKTINQKAKALQAGFGITAEDASRTQL